MPSTLRAWAQAWCHSNTAPRSSGSPRCAARRRPTRGGAARGSAARWPRHSAVPHSPRSNSTNGWSTRAVCQSRMPVSRWGGSGSTSSCPSCRSPCTRTGSSARARASASAAARASPGVELELVRRAVMRSSRRRPAGEGRHERQGRRRASRRRGDPSSANRSPSSLDGHVLHELVEGDAREADRAPRRGSAEMAGVLPHVADHRGTAGTPSGSIASQGGDLAPQRLDLGVVAGEQHRVVRGQQDELRPAREVGRRSVIVRPSRSSSRKRARRGGATTASAG